MTTPEIKPPVVDETESNTRVQEPVDQPERFVVVDEHTDRREYDLSRVKEALGIDDDDFCRGILERLYQVTGILHYGDIDFNYALSILKDYNFINKTHVSLAVDDIRCQLAENRISEKAADPIQYDVSPDDMAWALCYRKDIRTLPKRRRIIDDQPAVEFRLRWLCRLIETRIELLDAINRYEAARESLNKTETVTLVRRRHPVKRDPRKLTNGKALVAMKVPAKTVSATAKNSNGHAPT